MPAVDQLNVATRRFIQQNTKRLVDNLFTASPSAIGLSKFARVKRLSDEAGVDIDRAGVAVDVRDVFVFDDP